MPPPYLKENKCPYCGHTADNLWWEFDYITLVAGPATETVGKCKKCNGRFIVFRHDCTYDLVK